MANHLTNITRHAPKPSTLGAAKIAAMSPSSSWQLSFQENSSLVLQFSHLADSSTTLQAARLPTRALSHNTKGPSCENAR